MQYGGDWDGSNVHTNHIDFLWKTRRLLGKDQVRVHLTPEKEITLAPEEGERVIFRSHFLRGLGLPASAFFRSFLDFYQLQPHHLTPNTVVLLSASSRCARAFLGFSPLSSSRGNSSRASSAPSSRACPPPAEPSLP